jgi:hypothetical protein
MTPLQNDPQQHQCDATHRKHRVSRAGKRCPDSESVRRELSKSGLASHFRQHKCGFASNSGGGTTAGVPKWPRVRPLRCNVRAADREGVERKVQNGQTLCQPYFRFFQTSKHTHILRNKTLLPKRWLYRGVVSSYLACSYTALLSHASGSSGGPRPVGWRRHTESHKAWLASIATLACVRRALDRGTHDTVAK